MDVGGPPFAPFRNGGATSRAMSPFAPFRNGAGRRVGVGDGMLRQRNHADGPWFRMAQLIQHIQSPILQHCHGGKGGQFAKNL